MRNSSVRSDCYTHWHMMASPLKTTIKVGTRKEHIHTHTQQWEDQKQQPSYSKEHDSNVKHVPGCHPSVGEPRKTTQQGGTSRGVVWVVMVGGQQMCLVMVSGVFWLCFGWWNTCFRGLTHFLLFILFLLEVLVQKNPTNKYAPRCCCCCWTARIPFVWLPIITNQQLSWLLRSYAFLGEKSEVATNWLNASVSMLGTKPVADGEREFRFYYMH